MSLKRTVAIKSPVYVQKTLGTAKTITAITKASPAVCTVASPDLPAVGDVIVLSAVGFSQLDGQVCRVIAAAGTTFSLEGFDTSGYVETFGTATFQKVTAWDLLENARSVSAPDGSPNQIDATVLSDFEPQLELGMSQPVAITIEGLWDPETDACKNLAVAAANDSPRVLRMDWKNGKRSYVNSKCQQPGQGFQAQYNSLATASFGFQRVRTFQHFAN